MADIERFNADGLAFEARYAETMEAVILPALAQRRRIVPVRGDGDRPLYVEAFDADAPRGTVTLVHGFTENAYKYSELTYSLLQNGFSVVAYDHRGHGRSWRDPAISDLSLTHVDRFDEYVSDLKCVCEQALAAMPRPWTVFCHSMGGAVTGLFLENHPGTFARAAMCAPMIAARRNGMSMGAARAVAAVGKATAGGKARVVGGKPYAGPEDFDTSAATSRARFDWYDAVKAATPEYQNNGPSFGWLVEGLRVTGRLLAPGAPERIDIPVTLYTAALDGSVLPEEQKRFIDRVKQGRHVTVENARHEIFRSTDDTLFPWWHDVLTFLKSANPQ